MLGSCGVSELSGKLMIVASDVSSALLPDILSIKSVFNRNVIVVVMMVDYEMTEHLRRML
jgi:hypothetical protein